MSAAPPWPLLRLILGQICLHACMTGARMAAPLLALRDGHSALSVGALLALFALTQVFLALPAGRFADRHGLKRPVGISVLVASSGATLAVLFPIFPVLCLCALCAGGATGTALIALQRHVGRAARTPAERRQVFSWLAIGPAASNFLGPFAAGLLIDHAGTTAGDLSGYRAAFALLAVLPLLCWLWVRGTEELPPATPAEGQQGRAWELLREPMFRRLLGVNWLLSASWDLHTFVVPLLGHARGFSASTIGTLLGLFAVAATAIRFLLPVLASRLRESVVVSVAMGCTALIFAVYPLMPGALSMGLCSVLLGLSLGSVQPMIMSMLHHITPDARHGEALGLRAMAINASSCAMPLLFGSAGVALGLSALFWVTSLGVLLGLPLAWRLGAAGSHAAHADPQA